MSRTTQNLTVIINTKEEPSDISDAAANMILNRFCIDENAGFELTGIYHADNLPSEITSRTWMQKLFKGKLIQNKKLCREKNVNICHEFVKVLNKLLKII